MTRLISRLHLARYTNGSGSALWSFGELTGMHKTLDRAKAWDTLVDWSNDRLLRKVWGTLFYGLNCNGRRHKSWYRLQ